MGILMVNSHVRSYCHANANESKMIDHQNPLSPADVSPSRSSRSGTRTIPETEDIRGTIEATMSQHMVFLKARYSLDDLARDIGVPRHRLSATFASAFKTNFPSYINGKRIEYMLSNLNNPEWDRYTLEGIGRACGFNSRNAFIKCIKKVLGKNPSEVIRRHRG